LDIFYDQGADTLYISWGSSNHGVEVRPSTILRFSRDESLVGVTIYDVTRAFDFDPRRDAREQAAPILARVLTRVATSAGALDATT